MTVILYLLLQLLLLEQVQTDSQGKILVTRYTESCCQGTTVRFKPLKIHDAYGNTLYTLSDVTVVSNRPVVNTDSVLKSPIIITVPTNEDVFISGSVYDMQNELTRELENIRVPFTELSVGGTYSPHIWTSGDNTAQLALNYRLVRCSDHFTGDKCDHCENNYYTDRCNERCVPVEGNYTCNQSTGEKICEPGKRGDNCDQCENNNKKGQDCNTCKTGFTGDECDRCAENYYPTGTCDIICVPDGEKYNCLDSGAKDCLGNRIGKDCEECSLNHFGEDCETFCKNSTGYTCDTSGNKICRDKYYNPDKDRSKFCDPVQGNFTCNNATGEKICNEGKRGENCDQCENDNMKGQNCDTCKRHYFGDECQKFCEPNEHYTCSSFGEMMCTDNTTTLENHCGSNEGMDSTIIGGVVGGGVLLLLLIVIVVMCRRGKDKDTGEAGGGEATDTTQDQENQNEDNLYSRIIKTPVQVAEENQDVYNYARLDNKTKPRNEGKIRSQVHLDNTAAAQDPVYSTVDKPGIEELYSQVQRPGRSENAQQVPPRTAADQGETYAEVDLVTNWRGERAAVYRNQTRGEDEREITYTTVSDVIERRL